MKKYINQLKEEIKSTKILIEEMENIYNKFLTTGKGLEKYEVDTLERKLIRENGYLYGLEYAYETISH